MLLLYGFMDNYDLGSKDSYLLLSMEIKKNSLLFDTKMKIFSNENPVGTYFGWVPTPPSLSMLRIALFDDINNIGQFNRAIESYEIFSDTKTVPPFSSRNERNVMIQLIRMCQEKLAGYPRTLKGD